MAESEREVDRVYRSLKNCILHCEFGPGDFLAEVDLAQRCATSRTPTREACNRLSQEGWISQTRHKGYMIRQISVRHIVEIYGYRKVLERFNAEKAARMANPEQLAKLRAITQTENQPNPPINEILAANEVFHLGMGEIASNQRIMDQLKLALEYIDRLDILSTESHSDWFRTAISSLLWNDANPSQTSNATAEHIDNARDRMLKLFGS